jgi:hypothetical protein
VHRYTEELHTTNHPRVYRILYYWELTQTTGMCNYRTPGTQCWHEKRPLPRPDRYKNHRRK